MVRRVMEDVNRELGRQRNITYFGQEQPPVLHNEEITLRESFNFELEDMIRQELLFGAILYQPIRPDTNAYDSNYYGKEFDKYDGLVNQKKNRSIIRLPVLRGYLRDWVIGGDYILSQWGDWEDELVPGVHRGDDDDDDGPAVVPPGAGVDDDGDVPGEDGVEVPWGDDDEEGNVDDGGDVDDFVPDSESSRASDESFESVDTAYEEVWNPDVEVVQTV